MLPNGRTLGAKLRLASLCSPLPPSPLSSPLGVNCGRRGVEELSRLQRNPGHRVPGEERIVEGLAVEGFSGFVRSMLVKGRGGPEVLARTEST